MEFKKMIEKYAPYFMVILVISAILSALNFLGFDTNIFRWPHYYSTLDYDSKIFLVGAQYNFYIIDELYRYKKGSFQVKLVKTPCVARSKRLSELLKIIDIM